MVGRLLAAHNTSTGTYKLRRLANKVQLTLLKLWASCSCKEVSWQVNSVCKQPLSVLTAQCYISLLCFVFASNAALHTKLLHGHSRLFLCSSVYAVQDLEFCDSHVFYASVVFLDDGRRSTAVLLSGFCGAWVKQTWCISLMFP